MATIRSKGKTRFREPFPKAPSTTPVNAKFKLRPPPLDRNIEPMVDLEDESPITPLDEVARGSVSDKRGLELEFESIQRHHIARDNMHDFLVDCEQSIVDLTDVGSKVNAELRELKVKYTKAQQVGAVREDYITQMHHLHDGLNDAFLLSEVERDRREYEISWEIKRTHERAAHLEDLLAFMLDGLDDVFSWHMKDRDEIFEALNVIEEHVDDENEQLWCLYLFLKDAEESVWNLDVPSKDGIYADEVYLAGGRALLDRGDTMARMAMDCSPDSFQIDANGDVSMENAPICLDEEHIEVDADGDAIMREAHVERQVDTDQQRLRIGRPNVPDLPESAPFCSRSKPRGELLNWDTMLFRSPVTSPLTSPLPMGVCEMLLRTHIEKPPSYLLEKPPPPPSKRIRLNRPCFPVWGSCKEEEILARQQLKQGPFLGHGGLRRTDRPPPEMLAIVNATSNPEANMNWEIRGNRGRTLSVRNWPKEMMPGSWPEKPEEAGEGYTTIHYNELWHSLIDWMISAYQEVLAKPEEYATTIMGMGVMMWLAYYLRVYEDWMVANDVPLASSCLYKMKVSEIQLGEKALFGVNRWLDYERPWTG
ncbi:uncharacterized protein N7498_010779 [Penicillium cinerascens]|uniref:Uncharacterized protein n=1 Tax=Penicillium cinerascens TaxID=70096 RepID=A0A9W9J8L0_9EURO|nr:uncharacterized protein N7498_010779 [Penicillium cinerascens]KAJ5191794.1 hypothetical protein N7498_010779 [Penicillium cinerascens]